MVNHRTIELIFQQQREQEAARGPQPLDFGGALPSAAAGAGVMEPAPAISADHLRIVRRVVAESYRAVGFDACAESVASGEGDSLGRMQAGIAVAAALVREIFE